MPTTSRPPLDERAKGVLRLARLESRLSARLKKIHADESSVVGELRTTRRMLRDLMADAGTFGPDGTNNGDLP